MAKNSEPVTADELRQWVANRGYDIAARGRLPAWAKEMWNKAHRARKYGG